MSIRAIAFTAAMLCLVPLTVSVAQQPLGSPRVTVSVGSAAAPVAGAALAGPRLAPELRGEEQTLTRVAAQRVVIAPDGGENTIVISTLALVLGGILLAVLIVR